MIVIPVIGKAHASAAGRVKVEPDKQTQQENEDIYVLRGVVEPWNLLTALTRFKWVMSPL